MEKYFEQFRQYTIGCDFVYETNYGEQKLIYADWIASGRLYEPIEEKLSNIIGPFLANTHTETSETGSSMTRAYHEAHKIIKEHVNAGPEDVIITTGTGMTGAIVKLQRLLGLKRYGNEKSPIAVEDRPVIFITHMEHHSNHISWLETICDVVVLEPDENLLVNVNSLREEIKKYGNRKLKIGAFSACSNVTGIAIPYYQLAGIMHENNGLCFVDFAASAPYYDIDMHPENPLQKLDAITFSPHKFLGGPGASGVLIFDSSLYHLDSPDQPGGGTVDWTNPWGEYKYVDDIETREDGGTPGFMQAIRTALCIQLKELMGVENIRKREDELLTIAFNGLEKIQNLKILAPQHKKRLGVISFYFTNIHYNLVVKLLSDRFGIQVRGGCACAGTYGHYLLNVSHENSKEITDLINHGDLSRKPGWVRLSLHPTMTNAELGYIIYALNQIQQNHVEWAKDYVHTKRNEFENPECSNRINLRVKDWFQL
jgi:selenocysteine lyase/cysteine desulfurase